MSLYHVHEATFAVPAGWRDQSMNVFRLPGKNGDKDAAIILTRDYDTPLQDAGEYADAQQEAAKKSFPGYRSLGREDTEIGHQPATVVDYQWRSNGAALLRQRQAYVRHQGAMLTLTLSVLATEFARVEAAWNEFLGSFRLVERPAEPEPVSDMPEPGAPLPHVFVLSTRDRHLHVFPDAAQACAQVDPLEVEQDDWVFFDSTGAPLKPRFVIGNKRGVFKKEPGRYELTADTAGVALPLHKRLRGVVIARPHGPFTTLDRLAAHLEGRPLPDEVTEDPA